MRAALCALWFIVRNPYSIQSSILTTCCLRCAAEWASGGVGDWSLILNCCESFVSDTSSLELLVESHIMLFIASPLMLNLTNYIIEDPKLVNRRQEYIEKIRKYRSENRKVYYMDEGIIYFTVKECTLIHITSHSI